MEGCQSLLAQKENFHSKWAFQIEDGLSTLWGKEDLFVLNTSKGNVYRKGILKLMFRVYLFPEVLLFGDEMGATLVLLSSAILVNVEPFVFLAPWDGD